MNETMGTVPNLASSHDQKETGVESTALISKNLDVAKEDPQAVADKMGKQENKVFDAIGKKGNFGKDVNKGSLLDGAKDKNGLNEKLKNADKATVIGDNVNLRDANTGKPIGKLKKDQEVKIDKEALNKGGVIGGKNSSGRQEFFVPVEVDGKKGVVSSNFLKVDDNKKDGKTNAGNEAQGGAGKDGKKTEGGGSAISEAEFNSDTPKAGNTNGEPVLYKPDGTEGSNDTMLSDNSGSSDTKMYD